MALFALCIVGFLIFILGGSMFLKDGGTGFLKEVFIPETISRTENPTNGIYYGSGIENYSTH